MSRLADAQIDAALGSLPGWRREGDDLVTVRRFDDFAAPFALATRVALLAERRDHHPRLEIAWGRLRIALTSHDAGGITARDVEMARLIAAIPDPAA